MKKYILTIVFSFMFSSASLAAVNYCVGGKCQFLDEMRNYPQIYTAIYGIFDNSVGGDLEICDSDARFKMCRHNGIQYSGKVGVSTTDFSINALKVLDAKINPSNRNLEIIGDYYTYVNGKRVICSSAKDVLTLDRGNVSLMAKEVSCPYNMQFKSKNKHKYTIRSIDLDNKVIGIEYNIQDSIGADTNPTGFAMISFKNTPILNLNKIQENIVSGHSYDTDLYSSVTPPPSGMTAHISPSTPYSQPEQQFSYKSNLPYPWGYYYAPEGIPSQPKHPVPAPARPDNRARPNLSYAPIPTPSSVSNPAFNSASAVTPMPVQGYQQAQMSGSVMQPASTMRQESHQAHSRYQANQQVQYQNQSYSNQQSATTPQAFKSNMTGYDKLSMSKTTAPSIEQVGRNYEVRPLPKTQSNLSSRLTQTTQPISIKETATLHSSLDTISSPTTSEIKAVYVPAKENAVSEIKEVYVPAKENAVSEIKEVYVPAKEKAVSEIKEVYVPAKEKAVSEIKAVYVPAKESSVSEIKNVYVSTKESSVTSSVAEVKEPQIEAVEEISVGVFDEDIFNNSVVK